MEEQVSLNHCDDTLGERFGTPKQMQRPEAPPIEKPLAQYSIYVDSTTAGINTSEVSESFRGPESEL